MPKTKRTNHKNKILKVALVVLAILVCGGLVFALTRNAKNNGTSTNEPKKLNPAITNQANNDRKLSSTPSTTLDTSSGSGSTSTTTPFSATIVSSNVNNGNVHIGTLVNGTTSGDCTLTATRGSQTINLATAKVQADVNNYDCGVFNIPTSNFPDSGSWKLTLTVGNGSDNATGTATVQIQ